MTRPTIIKVFILTGIIPATFMLIISLAALIFIIDGRSLDIKNIVLVVSIILGVIGYLGFVLSLISPKNIKLNLSLLSIGTIGYITFISVEGGKHVWEWIFTMSEPGEWFLVCWPLIVALILIINYIVYLTKNTTNIT